VTHVERFGNVGRAELNNDGFSCSDASVPVALFLLKDLVQNERGQMLLVELEV